MSGSGLLVDYLGHGDAADRPATPVLFDAAVGLWWNDDTSTLDLWDGSAWQDDIGGASSGGDVVGPASSVDSRPALFDGTTGKLLKQASSTLGTAAFTASTAYATAAQGATADSAVQSVVAGTNVTVDNTDPQNPIVSASAGGGGDLNVIVEASPFTADPATHSGQEKLIEAGGDVTFDSAESYVAGNVFNIYATGSISLIGTGVTLTPAAGGTLDLDAGMAVSVVMDSSTTGFVIGGAAPGSGDVVGPASAVDDRLASFDGTTGKLIQDSGKSVSDFLQTSAIGSTVQAHDADLDAIAGLTSAADKGIQFTGAGTAGTFDLTAFARTLLDDTNQAGMQTTLGLVPGTNVQAFDADLAAIAGLTSSADKGIQFTGSGTAGTFDLTSFAKTILDDANQAAAQTTLGLVPGTNVQAFDADLAAIAGLTSAADKGIQFTGSGTAGTFDLTAFAKTVLDDANAVAARATLSAVGSGANNGTAATVSNTTTKTVVYTIPIPANSLIGTKSVRIKIGGAHVNNSGATATLGMECVFGSTTMWSSTSGALTASANPHVVSAEFNICALNSSSSQFMHGHVGISSPTVQTAGAGDLSAAVTAAAGSNTPVGGPSVAGSTENGTTALNFVFSVKHSVAASTITFTGLYYSIEFLN